MKRIIIALLICIPFVLSAQEVRYLNENFNKAEGEGFPPYGWRSIDNDGDGRSWTISLDGATDALGNLTMSASSHTWLFQDLYPDNWLITPQMIVENETDCITYWVGSFEGRPQTGEVYISTTGHDIEDFTLIDEIEFVGTYTYQDRTISLEDYVGETIYIAFRHRWMQTTGIVLALDNITGPRIKPLDYDLAVSGVGGFPASSCELADTKLSITIDNLGANAVSNFKIYYQSQGQVYDNGNTVTSYSELYSETIEQLNPGETLNFQCSHALPFSEYNPGTIYIRAFIDIEEDMYNSNDTYQTGYTKEETKTAPYEMGFESGTSGWYFSPRANVNAPFGIGTNSVLANSGSSYLAASVYASSNPASGNDVYASLPCLMMDETKDYRLNFFYAFRKFPTGENNLKKLNFKLIAGTDQRDLLNDHIVLAETTLETTRPLVMPDVQAEYDLFSSPAFKLPDSGIWYIGMMFYSDNPVTLEKDEWMIFVDDLSFIDTEYEKPIDLSLDKIIAPYDCNLSNEEIISFVVRNASLVPTTEITARYRINNGEWIEETFAEVLESNEQKELSFTTPADLSTYRKYRIEGTISHEGEENLNNNENMIITENKQVKELPFTDDFEEYPELKNFEDEYLVTGVGYYTWNVAEDYTGEQTFAYNGIGFLVDGYDVERYTAPDDWIVSCCFQFEANKEYDISFAYKIETYNIISSELGVYMLSDYDTGSVIETLGHLEIQNTDHQIFRATYKAAEDHIGHLAMHSYGGLGASIIMMDALSIVPSGTNIKEISTSPIAIYPNPATDYLHIDTKGGAVRSVELFSLLGSKVCSETYSGGATHPKLALAGYAKGNYLIKVVLESGEVIVEKVIIK